MTGFQHFNKEQKSNPPSHFNYHSLIPWGSFRGRQNEKWGSFRGWDHFRFDLGIISELGIISRSGSFRELYSTSFSIEDLHCFNRKKSRDQNLRLKSQFRWYGTLYKDQKVCLNLVKKRSVVCYCTSKRISFNHSPLCTSPSFRRQFGNTKIRNLLLC